MKLIQEQLKILKSFSKEGVKKEDAHNILKELNSRVELLLSQEHYDPDAHRNQPINLPDPSLQTQNVLSEIEQGRDMPALLLPSALDAMIKDLNKRISEDLLCFVHEECFDGSFSFVISTSSFGKSFSSSTPESDKKRVHAQLERMKLQGYVIDRHTSSFSKHTLEYCEENTSRIEAYLSYLFSRIICTYEVRDFVIDKINCRAALSSHYPFLVDMPEKKQISETLSADEAAVAVKTIGDFIGALSSYSFMNDKNMMLYLYESYTSQLEKIFGCELSIFQRVQKSHADARKRNNDARTKMLEAGQQAMKQVGSDLYKHYEAIKNGLAAMLQPWALSVAEFRLLEYRMAELILRPRTYYEESRAGDVCKAVRSVANYEDEMRCFEIPCESSFLNQFMEYLREFFPDAEIKSIEMRSDKVLFMSRITIHGDVKNLIQNILTNFSTEEQWEDI